MPHRPLRRAGFALGLITILAIGAGCVAPRLEVPSGRTGVAAGPLDEFRGPPRRLEAGGVDITTPAPGYASPWIADVTGDGRPDLLVGQFAGGRITVYPGVGRGRFGRGGPLQIDGEIASVPGIW